MVTTERARRTTVRRSISPRPWPQCALALGVGLAGGALTSFGQSALTGGWHALVNSASPWVTVALLIGMGIPGRWRTAAGVGVLSQLGLVVGYYATSELRGFAAGMSAVVIWVVAGVVAGPVYGAAGALLTDERRHIRSIAAGVTGSVWVMEGIRFLSLATDANSNSGPGKAAGWCYLLVGVLLPLALARSLRERGYALLTLAAASGAAIVAGLLIDMAFTL
ncbi:DUF6518 family protein [Streptomyces luteolus]|uniref:DUF6518 family protein n=1 Tax=Streptomyces luteolus TaxID=3043615 RepID=A0ABT6T7K9_9ACTN|nr:DUF6518 family protein [Streptomyces sp. B-S-A12]MDI3423844.1 DUF6518 family protein [Streptomyces sp. B-S-A12]